MGAGRGNTDAIMGAVDVFVGDDYYFGFGLRNDGLHRLSFAGSSPLRFASPTAAKISVSIHE
jgi:hypothetical protein